MIKLTNFMGALEKQLYQMTDSVNDVYVLAVQDCNMLCTRHAQLITGIQLQVMDAVASFTNFYYSSTYASVIQFRDILFSINFDYTPEERAFLQSRKDILRFTEENARINVSQGAMTVHNVPITVEMDYSRMNVSELIDMNVTLPNGTYFETTLHIGINQASLRAVRAAVQLPDDDFWNHTTNIWLKFATLRTVTELSMSSVRMISTILLRNLQEDIKNITIKGFLINPEQIAFIQPILRFNCSWCTDGNNPVLAIMKDRLTSLMNSTFQPKLEQLQIEIESIYNDFLQAMADNDRSLLDDIYDNRLPALVELADNLSNEMQYKMMAEISEALAFCSELLRQLEPKCDDAIVAKAKALLENHAKGVSILNEVSLDL